MHRRYGVIAGCPEGIDTPTRAGGATLLSPDTSRTITTDFLAPMEPAAPPDREAVLEQVSRIAASPAFRHADRLQRFLHFVALHALDGRHDVLKESVIGVEVFDRRPGYDPKLEPIVRIQARRLRAKLEDYYRTSGTADTVLIEIPKGGYVPQFLERAPAAAAVLAAVPDVHADAVDARPAAPRRGRLYALIPVTAALVIVGAAVAMVAYRTSRADDPAPRLVPLTSFAGDEFFPAVSPDGRQIAFSWDRDGNTDIYVKLLGSSRTVRLTTNPGHDLSPSWSPDRSTIAFYRDTHEKGEILTVPALGGSERKIAEIAPAWQTVASNTTHLPGPSWTPDGRFLAITDRQGASSSSGVALVSLDTGDKRRVTTPGAAGGDESPLVSPRGSWLAFVRCRGAGLCDIYIQPLGGGDAIALTSNRGPIFGLTWGPDERSLIFSASSSTRDTSQRLWRVWIRSRTIEPVPAAGLHVTQPSFAAGVLAFEEVFQNINLWKMDLRAPAASAPLLSTSRQTHSPSLSPDGTRLAFVSNAPGGDEIWTANADGSDAVQITSTGGRAGSPRWSPDGRSIAYDAALEELSAIYVVAASGGAPRRLTHGPAHDTMPSWSHDGRWIYYNSAQTGQGQVWKIPADGGVPPVQITRQGAHEPFESADGAYVYYLKADLRHDVWRVPSAGGEETPVEGLGGDIRVSRCWVVTDIGIYFISRGSAPRLGLYRFETRSVEWLAAIDRPVPDTTPSLTVARDRGSVIYAQIDSRASDIIAIQPFR